mgnify:CR=1
MGWINPSAGGLGVDGMDYADMQDVCQHIGMNDASLQDSCQLMPTRLAQRVHPCAGRHLCQDDNVLAQTLHTTTGTDSAMLSVGEG